MEKAEMTTTDEPAHCDVCGLPVWDDGTDQPHECPPGFAAAFERKVLAEPGAAERVAALEDAMRPWCVHYICCGRQWSEAQSFPTWEEADQHREWYVEQPMPRHDRVAIVSRDPQAYGWPA